MGVIFVFGLFTACSKDQEQSDLAKAQDCLDKVDEANPQGALNCLPFVQAYSSQRANILKCSIYLTSGGLVTSRIQKAYDASTDTTITNKQAAYIAYLSLNVPDVATGYTTAQTASPFCNSSGDPGLVFVSSMTVLGSLVSSISSNNGSPINFNDPAAVNTAVTNVLTTCQANPPPATCQASVVGPAVTSAANAYCASGTSSVSVCTQINGAVSGAGGDNNKITQGMMCLLSGKTYDSTANTCT